MDLPASLPKSAHMLVLRRICELGWEPTVVTIADKTSEENWNGVRIIRYKPTCQRWRALRSYFRFRGLLGRSMINLTDRAMRPALSLVNFPDRYAPAVKEFTLFVKQLVDREPQACILSLYYPFSSHLVAQNVATLTGLPWLALTKDYYSWPDHHQQGGGLKNRVKRRYERQVLSTAHAVAAVNDNIADYLKRLVPETHVTTLAHCYDDQLVEDARCSLGRCLPSNRPLTLVSVGKVDRSETSGIEWLLGAVGELLEAGRIRRDELQFRFVGFGGDLVQSSATRNRCSDVVKTYPQARHAEAMMHLHDADCLLFQQAEWGMRRRLPEYFATRKPILAFPHYEGAMSELLLHEYGASIIVDSKEELQNAILSLRETFQRNGTLTMKCDEKLVKSFSAQRRASELDELLKKLLQGGSPTAQSQSTTVEDAREHIAAVATMHRESPRE